MATLPAVVGVAWPVVVGGAGVATATFLVYRAYATWAPAGEGDPLAAGDDRVAAHHLRWARYTVVPVGAVAGAGVFVVTVEANVRTAALIVGAVRPAAGREGVVLAAMGLWGATVLAAVLAGVRGYAPLSRRRGAPGPSLGEAARTVAAAGAFGATLAGLVALLVVDPLAAAVAVGVGRPVAAAAAPAVVVAVERTRPLPAPWDARAAVAAGRLGVALRGARAVADDREARVRLAGLLPGLRVLFATDRALDRLEDRVIGVLVVRELARARGHAAARAVAVETVPVAVWLASFAVLAPGQALLVGVALVAPYAAAVGAVGQRAEFAADDAAAALVGPEAVVAAIERVAGANDVPERRDRLFDLLAGRPSPRRRVERLRGEGAGAAGGTDAVSAT